MLLLVDELTNLVQGMVMRRSIVMATYLVKGRELVVTKSFKIF
jgi:hypothetical protein